MPKFLVLKVDSEETFEVAKRVLDQIVIDVDHPCACGQILPHDRNPFFADDNALMCVVCSVVTVN